MLLTLAARSCAWSERWFPDAFAFVLIAVAVVAAGALAIGVAPLQVAVNFGNGFWSVIPFTMQMTFIVIGGYVTADSPPIGRLIRRLAALPKSPQAAVALVAVVGMLVSLLHWGLSLVLASLLVRALARRQDLQMDYRAGGAAACLGLGTVWALGLSSSAAQLQANPASMPPALLATTGVIPFGETIFLWQSLLLAAVLIMQAARQLQYHLGWTVQIYNAAEALPNLINPFWMLPVLGILQLRARDLIGFTFVQFVVNLPLVLALLWVLGATLSYHAPVIPT